MIKSKPLSDCNEDAYRIGRRLRIDQQFAAIGVDELAGDTRGLLRLALGIADHHVDLTPGETACGVDLVDLNHHAIT